MTTKLWWVNPKNNNILVSQETGKPSNLVEVEGPDLPRDSLYFDGTDILEKPEKPSQGNWYWSSVDNDWKEIKAPQVPEITNWKGLYADILETTAWDRIEAAYILSLPFNGIISLLITLLTSTQGSEERLEDYVIKLRNLLVTHPETNDFTQQEIDQLNSILEARNFAYRLTDATEPTD